jgi:hypothetical protein
MAGQAMLQINALVFMLHGHRKKLKQTLAYYMIIVALRVMCLLIS